MYLRSIDPFVKAVTLGISTIRMAEIERFENLSRGHKERRKYMYNYQAIHFLGNTPPNACSNNRIPINLTKEIDLEIILLLKKVIMNPSQCLLCTHILPVDKADKSLLIYIDHLTLNQKRAKKRYKLTRIDNIINDRGVAKYFSIHDVTSGYHHAPFKSQT